MTRRSYVTALPASALLLLMMANAAIAAEPAAPVTQPDAVAPSTDMATVEALVAAYLDAFRHRDLAAMEKLWAHTEAVTVIENGTPEYGWERFYGYHLLPEFRSAVRLDIQPENLRTHVNADTAWVTFTYRARIVLEERTIDTDGAATLVAQRDPDGWHIVHTHMSGQRPAP